MDIAYYLSDLLGQQGELSVPNLGYFVQIRMPAYYDSEAKKFYPPHFSIQFDPQVIDEDDSLAAYITGLKKISLASAKYFIEKYISNLKSQAVIEDVPFANLGSFHSDGIKLSFTPGVKTDAPAFFAFSPLEAYAVGEEAPVKAPVIPDEPVIAPYINPEPFAEPEPESQPEIIEPAFEPPFEFTPPPAADVAYPANAEPEYFEEAPTRSIGAWTIILIVLTILAITFVGLYKFKPGLFKDWLSLHKNPYTASQPIAPPAVKQADTTSNHAAVAKVQVSVSGDTLSKNTLKRDTTQPKVKTPVTIAGATTPVASSVKTPAKTTVNPAKLLGPPVVKTTAKTTAVPVKTIPPVITTPAAMPDSIAKGSWLIYGGAFPIRSSADKAVSNYKSLGYAQARLLSTNVKRGNNYKVILGSYKTKAEATDASKILLMSHKISISVEQYK